MTIGHYPKNVKKYKSWTAEEWKIFSFPVAEVLFVDILSDDEYHLVWFTARLVELLFHHRNGLAHEELLTLNKICWRRLVLLEEQVCKKQCVITSHNSIHIKDDMLRFGHCDNFWCFSNERVIKR